MLTCLSEVFVALGVAAIALVACYVVTHRLFHNWIPAVLIVFSSFSTICMAGTFQPTGDYAVKTVIKSTSIMDTVKTKERIVIKSKTATPQKTSYSQYSQWFVNGHNTPDSHLIRDHGVDPSLLIGLTVEQKNRLHGKMHTTGVSTVRSTTTVRYSSPCPGGICPNGRRRR